jgi:hypothetical protein
MKKRFLASGCILIIILYANSCIALSEVQKQQYGSLITAVTLSKSAVKGEFGHNIPVDFNAAEFMGVIKDHVPGTSYHTLEKYHLQVIPKEGYYLLKVFDPKDNALILFDYSCDLGVEGRVLEEPGKYDVNNLQLYDKCQKRY